MILIYVLATAAVAIASEALDSGPVSQVPNHEVLFHRLLVELVSALAVAIAFVV